MSDTEVESILQEIREQVYAQRAGQDGGSAGSDDRTRVAVQNGVHSQATTPELDLLRAQMPILARSWDRLPPIVSVRRGLSGRLELWVKSKARILMRWFTWEQVNFNAAVHRSLLETINLLDQLQSVREQLQETQARVEATLNEQKILVSERISNLDEFRNATEYQLRLVEQQAESVERSLTNLAGDTEKLADEIKELRSTDERRAEEQRVCFKQLSLESSETAVMVDRARRKLDERLAELNQQPLSNSKVERSSTKAGSSQK